MTLLPGRGGAALVLALLVGCTSANPSPPASPSGPAIRSRAPVATVTSPAVDSSADVAVAPFAAGFGALTFVTGAGDGSGSLYALEQQGRIRSVAAGNAQPSVPFLDLTDRVSSGGERGLLGLAFHPNFASNGRFFVDYTNLAGDSVVSEFTRAVDGTLAPAGERILLTVKQPFANHNGGMLAFGPDGYLYVSLGDGGSGGDPQGNGQNTAVLLAKILRIDVDAAAPYAVPRTNPFAYAANGDRGEIWDWGLRNPWRFSFDRKSGALFIGDVGQGAWEEVDVEPAGRGGRNYGWNIMEGDHCYGAANCDQTGLTSAAVEYGHDQGCAVTGGYVYRGTLIPSLWGKYVLGDYCSGRLWAFDADTALSGASVQPTQIGQVDFALSSFGEDDGGELYVVDAAGAIYKLVAGA